MKKDNTLPSGIQDLMQLAGEMADGLAIHGPFLKMTQTPEGAFRAMLERLLQAETRFGEARAAKGEAGKESTAADKGLANWLTRARGLLSTFFGQRWSERWLQAGVTSGRTAIPKRMALRIALARGFVDYFGKTPHHEHADSGMSHAHGAAVLGRLVQAQRDLRRAKADCLVKKRARDAAERAMRRKMRQVVVILGVTIRANDPRWLDFGLNRPQPAPGEAAPAAVPQGAAESSAPISLPTAEPVLVEADDEAAAA